MRLISGSRRALRSADLVVSDAERMSYVTAKCHILALALHRLTDWPILGFGVVSNIGAMARHRSMNAENVTARIRLSSNLGDDVWLIHFAVRHSEWGVIDASGHRSLAQRMAELKLAKNDLVLVYQADADELESFCNKRPADWCAINKLEMSLGLDVAQRLLASLSRRIQIETISIDSNH